MVAPYPGLRAGLYASVPGSRPGLIVTLRVVSGLAHWTGRRGRPVMETNRPWMGTVIAPVGGSRLWHLAQSVLIQPCSQKKQGYCNRTSHASRSRRRTDQRSVELQACS